MRNLKVLCREILISPQSNRALGDRFAISSTTVGRYRLRLAEEGLDAAAIEGWDEKKLERRLNDGRYRNRKQFAEPDWAAAYAELQRTGVTLTLLYEEYAEGLDDGVMSETEFRRRYKRYQRTRGLVMRQERRPGEALYLDYSGKRPYLTCPETGQLTPVELFVGAMGASRKTFAIATYTQRIPDWIHANVQALAFYGGVPLTLVPDNLKAAVTQRKRKEGPLLNPTYVEFANHYETFILPTRVRRPDDKATVESAVQIAQRYILGRLRNRVFFSLEELNAAIALEMERLNNKPMRGAGGKSRNQLFEELDHPALKSLPPETFVYGEWTLDLPVGPDYHVRYNERYYSVPFTLVGKKVRLKATHQCIEIYQGDRRVALHQRAANPGDCRTLSEHRPQSHQAFAESRPAEVLAWAERQGGDIHRFVLADMEQRRSPMLTVQLCQRLQRLVREYDSERVQAACARALQLKRTTITCLRSQLKRGFEHLPVPGQPAANDDASPPVHENIRGAAYYT